MSARQFSEVELEKEIAKSLHTNASMPVRLASEAEPSTIDYDSEDHSTLPLKWPSGVESHAGDSLDSRSNGPKPVRLPSEVEPSTIDSGSVSGSHASSPPLKWPSEVEYMTQRSLDPQSNASKPVRLASEVKASVVPGKDTTDTRTTEHSSDSLV